MWKNEGTNATVGGEFTDGNPVGPVPRSILGAEWLNMIQRELQNLVTGAGLALDEGNQSQVLAAVIALAASRGFTTGDGKITLKTVADPGWVMANDGTIGSAGSGATTRANADTQALYSLLWNNIADTHAPVTGGRGVSAAADFAANKPIALTKQLGRAIAVAGAGAGLTARALGSALGEEGHVQQLEELVGHAHQNETTNIPYDNAGNNLVAFAHESNSGPDQSPGPTVTGSQAGETPPDPMNVMQPTAFWNVMIKL